jgi:hypothetical protein
MYMKNDKINEKTRNKDKYGSIKIHDVENTTVINTDRIKKKKKKWGTCMSHIRVRVQCTICKVSF